MICKKHLSYWYNSANYFTGQESDSCTMEVFRTQFSRHKASKCRTETSPSCLHLKYRKQTKDGWAINNTVLFFAKYFFFYIFSVHCVDRSSVKMKRSCDVLRNKFLRERATERRISKFPMYVKMLEINICLSGSEDN